MNEDGRITKVEIKALFDNHGLYLSEEDAQKFMDRYDKDKDGRISYAEFREEITPHSPERRRV